MSGPRTGKTGRRKHHIRVSSAVGVIALAILAAACGSSSPHAASSAPPPAATVATTTTVKAPAGSAPVIKLVSETGVTPAQLQRADKLLAATIVGLKRFRTPAEAY